MTLRPNPIDAGASCAPKTRVCGVALDSAVPLGFALVCATATLTSPASAQVGVQDSKSQALASSDVTAPANTSQSTLAGESEVVKVARPESATTQVSAGHATTSPHLPEAAVSSPESTFIATTEVPLVADEVSATATMAKATAATQAISANAINLRAAQVALERGRELAKLGLLQLAERQWRESVRLAPDWVEAHRALGHFLAGHEQWLEASMQWREVLRLTHQTYRAANGKGFEEAKRRAWQAEAQREFELARTHLLAPWQTPNIVNLTADSRNLPSGTGIVTIAAHAMLHPGRLSREAQRAQHVTGSAVDKQSSQRAGQATRNPRRSLLTKQLSRTGFSQVNAQHAMPVGRNPRHKGVLRSVKPTVRSVRNSNERVPKRLMLPEYVVAQRGVMRHVSRSIVASRRIQARRLARIALERAEQLAASGVPALAQAQLQQAVSYAPEWSQSHRALARWHAAREQWEEAATSWNKVLSLPDTAARTEALLELRRCRQMTSSLRLTRSWDTTTLASTAVVTLGADSSNASTSDSLPVDAAVTTLGEIRSATTRATLSIAPVLQADEGRPRATHRMSTRAQSTLEPSSVSQVPPTGTFHNRVLVPQLAVKTPERMLVANWLGVRPVASSPEVLPSRSGRWVLSLRLPAAAEAARAADVPIKGAAAVDDANAQSGQ